MNIQVAVLCDAATDDNGKLNLLGAFDTIYTQQLPAVHPQCSIALRVTFGSEANFLRGIGKVFAKAAPLELHGPFTVDQPWASSENRLAMHGIPFGHLLQHLLDFRIQRAIRRTVSMGSRKYNVFHMLRIPVSTPSERLIW